MRILVLVTNLVEESELIGTTSLLDRAKLEVDLVSIKDTLNVVGSHSTKLVCDKLLKDINYKEYDALFLPGGAGVTELRGCNDVLEITKYFYDNNKLIFAICAAPSILGVLGILDNKKFSCYPTFEEYMPKGIHSLDGVSVCKNIITGKSVNFVTPFALEVIKYLLGEDAVQKVKKQICY